MRSKAQVSEATTQASPKRPSASDGQIAVCHTALCRSHGRAAQAEREGQSFLRLRYDSDFAWRSAIESVVSSRSIPEVCVTLRRILDVVLTPHRIDRVPSIRALSSAGTGTLGDAWVVASETCAFDLIEAQYVRDVEPGEMLVISQDGLRSSHPLPPQRIQCAYSSTSILRGLISLIYGHSVNESRHKLGKRLAI